MMMRSYTFSGLMLLASGLSAQSHLSTIGPAPKGMAPAVLARPAATHAAGAAARGGSSNCVLSEDFESVTVDQLESGGWSIGPDVEELNDQTGAGTGQFTAAWRVADAATGSSTYLVLPDEPPGNHFIVANDDGDPCNCNMSDVGLVTPSMDFTGLSDMSVSFRAYTDANFGGDTAHVQASTDGGANWTDIFTIDPVENAWQNLVVHLDEYDGMADVKLRWRWSDNGEWATGLAVDDICVSPILPNNLAVQQSYMADVRFAGGGTPTHVPYTFMPIGQAQPLDVTVAVINNGGQAQTNVVADVEVFMNGTSVNTTSSVPLATLAAGATDSLIVNTGWTPSEAGEVRVHVSVHADETEGFPGDNDDEAIMRITDEPQADLYNMWGQDRDAAASFSDGGTPGTNPYKIANLFEVLNTGSVAYGVAVAFGNVDGGTIVNGRLLDGGSDNFDPLVGSDDFVVQPWMTNDGGQNNFTFIPFTEPFALQQNSTVLAALISFGGSNVQWGNSGASLKRTSFINTNNEATWFYTTSTPMVRIYMAEAPTGVAEVEGNGLTLGPNVPNPFNDNTTIQYELDNSRLVNITVTDVDGKVVLSKDLGRQGQGRHAFDVDATKLAAGVYSYTLTAGEDRLTRRMMIVK